MITWASRLRPFTILPQPGQMEVAASFEIHSLEISFPPTGLTRLSSRYIQTFYPAPNRPGQADNIVNSQSGSLDTDQFTIRIDHKISEKNNFFSRFSYVQSEQLSPLALQTHSSSLTNAFRNFMISGYACLQSNHDSGREASLPPKQPATGQQRPGGLEAVQDVLESTGLQGVPIKNENVPLYPQFFITGYTNPQQDGFPFPDDTYQILANLSKTKGKHFIKFGMDYQNRRNLDDGLFSANIDFTKTPTEDPQNATGTGQALASYLLGLPTNALRNVGDTTALMRWSGYYFYVQDDIKVKFEAHGQPWTEVRLYSVASAPRQQAGLFRSWKPDSTSGPPPTRLPEKPANTFPTVIHPDRNNLAPRVGMAYLLNNSMTIRAGYGGFYNTNFLWEAQGIRGNWPFAISETKTNLNATIDQFSTQDDFLAGDVHRPGHQCSAG